MDTPKQTEYSVIIPVYGRGDCLTELVLRLDNKFNDLEWTSPEVVMIDDCGSSESWDRIQEITRSRSNTKGIQLSRNFGQHNAIMCGFHHAAGDIIITIDDDLQQEPESIPRLIDALKVDDLDLVYGAYAEKQHAFGRNIGSNLVNRFYRLIFKSPVTVTSFRAIRRDLVSSILRYELNFTYIDGLLAWNTTRIGTADIPHHERRSGQSGYTLSKLLVLAMNIFTNFSLLPLQIVSFMGITSAFLGISLGGWYAISALLTQVSVPGYASTIVAVLVLGGFQLLSLGIMGEYIGRLHLNVNRKPQFNVRKTTKSAHDCE
ncbi:glycosyltransferase [bacterium]|nr:glycosyltransferase [bacterium]